MVLTGFWMDIGQPRDNITGLSTCQAPQVVLQDKLEGGSMWKGSSDVDNNERYLEAVQGRNFHMYAQSTSGIRTDWATKNSPAFIVTAHARTSVKKHASKSVLHLQLPYSKVKNCTISKTIGEQGLSDSIRSPPSSLSK
ncbi:hypothetical protein Syun_004583 [Stephania yunnanensis]|uniref:Uncharacterized protein n=1 Tax=Stephania yunnanensis TaxID=152371 RepID=A0AAP0L3S1_9MAGN